MTLTRRRWSVVLLACQLTACAGWQRSVLLPAESLPPRARRQIWVGRTAHEVHSVVVRGDSISAVPVWRPPECDSCRIAFALAEVDSLRAPDVHSEVVVIGGVLLVALLIISRLPPKGYTIQHGTF